MLLVIPFFRLGAASEHHVHYTSRWWRLVYMGTWNSSCHSKNSLGTGRQGQEYWSVHFDLHFHVCQILRTFHIQSLMAYWNWWNEMACMYVYIFILGLLYSSLWSHVCKVISGPGACFWQRRKQLFCSVWILSGFRLYKVSHAGYD